MSDAVPIWIKQQEKSFREQIEKHKELGYVNLIAIVADEYERACKENGVTPHYGTFEENMKSLGLL